MDAIKQQLLKVQQQLAGLSASQKMLTASLVAIMVMTLFYWSRLASTSDMEAVIDKTLTGDELANVRAAIVEQGIEPEVRDGRVYVPANKVSVAMRALTKLASDDKLPKGLADAAPADDNKLGFLSNASERAERRLEKAGRVAEGMIRGWKGVTSAKVSFNGERRAVALSPEKPIASVAITFDGSAAEAKRVAASTRMNVSHMLSGLEPEGVGITINGTPYPFVKDDNGLASDDAVLAARIQSEKYFTEDVIKSLAYVGKVQVTVRVKMQTSSSDIYEYKVDPKNKVVAPQTETSFSENTTAAVTGGETAVIPNAGISESSTAAGPSTSKENASASNVVMVGQSTVNTKTQGGNNTPQSAAIGVPMSYYRRVWEQSNPGATGGPSMDELNALVLRESASIRESVKAALTIADDASVIVKTYFEEIPKEPAIVAAGVGNLPAASTFGAKEIAIGALAVISLLMVSMMVKKSSPQPQLAVAGPTSEGPIPMDAGMSRLSIRDLASEVPEADLTMTGQELSEDAIEARQVIEQVGSMVKQNPDVAANLVKRWMNQD